MKTINNHSQKFQELQVDIDGMKLEITRKDATISMLKNEKFRANNEIAVLDGCLLFCSYVSYFIN